MMVKLRWGYLKVQYVTSFGTCWGYLVSMLPLLDSSETQFVEMSKMLFIHVLSMFFFFFYRDAVQYIRMSFEFKHLLNRSNSFDV